MSRTGYPWAGCSPAEPASVSPDVFIGGRQVLNEAKILSLYGAGGEGRTLMPSEGRGILSPVRLPVPPLQPGMRSAALTRKSQGITCRG